MHKSSIPDSYSFRDWCIPARMMPVIRRYIEEGIETGDFLTAVITNNFSEACARADDENLENLPAYAAFFYNEAPERCYGSVEKMQSWMATFRGGQDAV